MFGRIGRAAWRHEPAELPQGQLRSWRRLARARGGVENLELRKRTPTEERRQHMGSSKKGTEKKKETVRPWLVDVVVEKLR